MTRALVFGLLATLLLAPRVASADPPAAVTFSGDPTSAISSGVAVPAGTSLYWTSGTPPTVALGDMKTQSENVLRKIDATLKAQGLGLHDVVYLRVYLRADRTTGIVDYKGWFDAYGEFFGTPLNTTKPARSTVAVAVSSTPIGSSRWRRTRHIRSADVSARPRVPRAVPRAFADAPSSVPPTKDRRSRAPHFVSCRERTGATACITNPA